jgi:tyrosyl-tRNA synthetase
VIRYLKYFTFFNQEDISGFERIHNANRAKRDAQTQLALAVTKMVHDYDSAMNAAIASSVLFGGSIRDITEESFNFIVGEVPTTEIEKSKLDGVGIPLVELSIIAGLCPSKGQARKDIESGGIYIQNNREPSVTRAVTTNDLIFGKHILLRKGKKNYVVVTAK